MALSLVADLLLWNDGDIDLVPLLPLLPTGVASEGASNWVAELGTGIAEAPISGA